MLWTLTASMFLAHKLLVSSCKKASLVMDGFKVMSVADYGQEIPVLRVQDKSTPPILPPHLVCLSLIPLV